MGKWSELKAAEKARVIQLAMLNGVSDVNTIRDTYNIYAEGGEIHIAPSKRGTFTAAAKKHGKSVQAFASQVLAHKDNYSPAMVKKANFARNAAHWHKTGGPLYPFSFGNVPSVRYGIGGHLFQDGGEYGKFQENVEYEILQKPTIEFIRNVVGAQRWARKHPETDQRGNNAEFWDRLMADTIQTIPDWEHKGEVASHKMAYTEDDGTYYIYPMVQMVDGKLVDYTNPKNKGVDAYMQARKNNNYIVAPNEAIASNFSKAYKQYEAFKGMAQFRDLANVMDDNVYHSNPKRIDTMYKMITDKGLDPIQAAGIIGSALVESRMNEYQHEVGNGQRGYGLMQWTNPIRRANLDAFKPKGIKTEFERQVAFMLEELQNPEMWVGGKKSLDAFMEAKTVEDAVKIFAEKYEHPKDAHMDRRVAVGELIHKTKAKK